MNWRKALRYLIYSLLALLLLVLLCNFWVLKSTEDKLYSDLDKVPPMPVALVLGTSRSVDGQHENPFFSHRVQAAAALYHAGKVKHFIVSGDNSNKKYNEALDMQQALVAMGVPVDCITMDFAGLRTLDSILRCKYIFQQNKVLIISQEFHNHRALFIAQYYGMEVLAFNAKHPSIPTPKTILREYLARTMAVWDVYVVGTQPKFMGDKIEIRIKT